MRKIIILFVISVILVITGACVFAMEVNSIERVSTTISTTLKQESEKFHENIKEVVIDSTLYSQDMNSITSDIWIEECKQDSSLAPNEILIEFNDQFKLNISELGETATIKFYSELGWLDVNDSNPNSFEDFVKAWKEKKIEYQSHDELFLSAKIRYGANLKVIDSDSEEYQNRNMQYTEQSFYESGQYEH